MLQSIYVKNYALIEDIQVSFGKGLSVITGETGAGKSILLDALGLLLGNRADLDSLRDKEQKCTIEAHFSLDNLHLESLFETLAFDYDKHTVVRREILPGGKSRAFVNDSPVGLQALSQLGTRLIDIHSQHQTLQLAETDFQFQLLDALAQNSERLQDYRAAYQQYQTAEKELQALIDFQKSASKEQEFDTFQLEELEQAALKPGVQETLEQTVEQLSNVEDIQQQLSQAIALLDHEEMGVLKQLNQIRQALQAVMGFSKDYQELFERTESARIELFDISTSLQNAAERLEADPETLAKANEQLQRIYFLQKKHNVQSVEALIAHRDQIAHKVLRVLNLTDEIQSKQQSRDQAFENAKEIAEQLHKSRLAIIPELEKQLREIVAQLGMQHARFQIVLTASETFDKYGRSRVEVQFSANKGLPFGLLKKMASGGELSRVMLAVKAVLAKHMRLPTIIFDEIDTGISGEVAKQMAEVLDTLSRSLQVIAITHLPQIAAKGQHHLKVYKETLENTTRTQLTVLKETERIRELAEMLGGKSLTDAAMAHAQDLLANKG
ncbi:MAG: DNA repair protein RecN [Flavobacteriaceae bacterium]|nr:DNA repair protein RecN [Flavobacteriaceae bacterium]